MAGWWLGLEQPERSQACCFAGRLGACAPLKSCEDKWKLLTVLLSCWLRWPAASPCRRPWQPSLPWRWAMPVQQQVWSPDSARLRCSLSLTEASIAAVPPRPLRLDARKRADRDNSHGDIAKMAVPAALLLPAGMLLFLEALGRSEAGASRRSSFRILPPHDMLE